MPTVDTEVLDHLHIYSADPSATLDFYITHFGAELSGVFGEGKDRPLHFMQLGGQLVAVSAFPPGIEAQEPPSAGDGAYTHGFGLAHLGIRVKSVDAGVEGLRAAGVPILTEPVSDGVLRYAYIAAPDGVVIELTQYGG